MNSNDENPCVSYNARVELVEKRLDSKGEEAGWTLTIKQLVKIGPRSIKAVWTHAVRDIKPRGFPGVDNLAFLMSGL
jgi:hypothetical protein